VGYYYYHIFEFGNILLVTGQCRMYNYLAGRNFYFYTIIQTKANII